MKKAIDFFTAHPARFFLLAALLWGGFMCFLNYKDGKDFSWHDLLVEANGMVFDLLVFGVLLSIYEALREKRDKIERLHEEIDDYRGWDEKEATFRIVGAVRRLNKLGVSRIMLMSCFLQKAKFFMVNLEGATLFRANLEGAILIRANLQDAMLLEANLRNANLLEVYLKEANLESANLENTNLQGSNLSGANFQDAIVDKDWFKKLEYWQVIGREEIKEKYFYEENFDKNGYVFWRLREKQ